jgi:hypothetical protein
MVCNSSRKKNLNELQKDIMLWSASIVALPHLAKCSWVVFDHTKVPAPSFRIKKFKNRETLLEVAGEQGSMFGEMVAGHYKTRTHIHDGKSTYVCDKRSKVIWFAEGYGWCVGHQACIGTRVCLFHASDFALTPDAVQSSWMVQIDPVNDPRVQVVLASAEPSRSPAAGQQAFPGNNAFCAALQVAVVGMTDGCNGLYTKVQHIEGNALYKRTAADGNNVVWFDVDYEQWCIGAEGSNGGCYWRVATAESATASSPLASVLTWYGPAWEPFSSIRVTKSKKKHTKIIEVKGAPTDVALLNGKYRQQALVVDGKPTFKGGQDSNHVIWYSERAGEWRIGQLGFVGTSAHLVHAEDTAATPNTVKAIWYAPLGTSPGTTNRRYNPFVKIILPSVEAAEQEVLRQMQLKMPEVLAAEEKRCLGCGHQYTSVAEVVFHEECMHHHCVCCQEGLGDAECAVCMED